MIELAGALGYLNIWSLLKQPDVRRLLHYDHGFQYISCEFKAFGAKDKFAKSKSRVCRFSEALNELSPNEVR